jgi:hypothetical protein
MTPAEKLMKVLDEMLFCLGENITFYGTFVRDVIAPIHLLGYNEITAEAIGEVLQFNKPICIRILYEKSCEDDLIKYRDQFLDKLPYGDPSGRDRPYHILENIWSIHLQRMSFYIHVKEKTSNYREELPVHFDVDNLTWRKDIGFEIIRPCDKWSVFPVYRVLCAIENKQAIPFIKTCADTKCVSYARNILEDGFEIRSEYLRYLTPTLIINDHDTSLMGEYHEICIACCYDPDYTDAEEHRWRKYSNFFCQKCKKIIIGEI